MFTWTLATTVVLEEVRGMPLLIDEKIAQLGGLTQLRTPALVHLHQKQHLLIT